MRMRVLLSLVILLGAGGTAIAGNGFNDSSGDHTWNNPANWDMGVVPQDATTSPDVAVPQWNNDVGFYYSNVTLNVGPGQTTASYSLQLACYGATNTVMNLSNGGRVNVGGWGMDIGRGNDPGPGNPSIGTLNMTGGTISITGSGLCIPQEWTSTGNLGNIVGIANVSGGEIDASFLRIGMYDGVGTMNLAETRSLI